ncbi:MAG: hypothetical protein OEY81_00775 [Candidatus Bathyarchaeota archaeon]|nr:hypothetical protein [Candidatus Bathyarchaeota archaeon]
MLKETGGNMLRSAITEKCGFSKSKTSELLKSMEKRRVIKRKKKGREKTVKLIVEREQFLNDFSCLHPNFLSLSIDFL